MEESIYNEIQQKLNLLEKEKNIRILYACESGSRAWGFPSQDSDYDVRFIYVHETNWYLSINNRKDHISDVGKVLDFSGWELRKALGLFFGSNQGLFEKLQSPIIYKQVKGFREEMWDLAPDYFIPQSGIHHYIGISHNMVKEALEASDIKLKKYFYILRSALAARWIRMHHEIPPMEFEYLRADIYDEYWNTRVDGWLEQKMAGDESEMVSKDEMINQFIQEEITATEAHVKNLNRKERGDIERLNVFFRKWLNDD